MCLESYLNKNSDGKLVMTDEQDERLSGYINQIVSGFIIAEGNSLLQKL